MNRPPDRVILIGMTHKVGWKGQVVIPKDLRDRHGFMPGTDVAFRETDAGVLIEPVTVELRFGMFGQSGMADRLLEDRRAERD